MKRKYVLSMAVAAVGSAALAVAAAHAHGGFGPHGHHHGSAAAKACIAVMTPEQRGNLKTIFTDAKTSLMSDHQKLMSARQDLTLAILSKNNDLGSLENNVSAARLKLLQDQDAAAAKVCGLLSPKQLSAAEGLYKNMVSLRQNTHQQAREYFKQARAAAGDTNSETGSQSGAQGGVE